MLETITIMDDEDGERTLLLDEFFALPLRERVHLILGSKLVFRRDGEIVEPRHALEKSRDGERARRSKRGRRPPRGGTRHDPEGSLAGA